MNLSIELQRDTIVIERITGFPSKLKRAVVRAINRGIKSARTFMVRSIADDTGLASKTVRDALRLDLATEDRPEATLAAKLKRIPLIDFHATGPEPSRGKGRGVAYRLSGGRTRLPHAFIATMPSGHRGVFARQTKARLGISELKGPSLGHVFGKYREAGFDVAKDAMAKNLTHELVWANTEALPEAGSDV